MAVLAVACVAIAIWYSKAAAQARVDAANERIAAATAEVNEWIAGTRRDDPAALERRLTEALANDQATEKADGDLALKRLHLRRQFVEAKKLLDAKRVSDAVVLLEAIAAENAAPDKDVANRLLAEIAIATSEEQTRPIVEAMDDASLQRVIADGVLADGQVSHVVLAEMRKDLVRRAAQDEAAHRAERRRVEEALQMAAMRQAEEKRLADEARQKERAKPIPALFDQLANFPERFVDHHVLLERVWLSGALERMADYGVFGASVSGEDGKNVFSSSIFFVTNGRFQFMLQESFGSFIDGQYEDNVRAMTNLSCLVVRISEKKFAAIVYKIEVY